MGGVTLKTLLRLISTLFELFLSGWLCPKRLPISRLYPAKMKHCRRSLLPYKTAKSEAVSVTLTGKDTSLARFSENQISQNITEKDLRTRNNQSLRPASSIGCYKRSGSRIYSTNTAPFTRFSQHCPH